MSSLFSYVGWAFLPNYATTILQNVYYGITIRAGEPRPQPPSPRYHQHRRRIFILVVTSYLLYTLYDTFYHIQAAGDFYSALGVSPFTDDKTIKSRFRRLAALHHPDKLTSGASNVVGGDEYFVFLKMAHDTILNPAKRFAYDRFGPNVVGWGDRGTMQDFLFMGLYSMAPQYVGGILTLMFLNFVWLLDWGRYWRFYSFAVLVTLELVLIAHPLALFSPGALLPSGLRSALHISIDQPGFYLLPFQIAALARHISVTLHIFISQITPPEVANASSSSSSSAEERLSSQTLQRLGQARQLAQAVDAEATRLVQLGFAPFRGDKESVGTLRKGMREGLVLHSVKASPGVQRAVAKAIKRKNGERDDEGD